MDESLAAKLEASRAAQLDGTSGGNAPGRKWSRARVGANG